MTETVNKHDPRDGTELVRLPDLSPYSNFDMTHAAAILRSAKAVREARCMLLEGVPAAEAVLIHIEAVHGHP